MALACGIYLASIAVGVLPICDGHYRHITYVIFFNPITTILVGVLLLLTRVAQVLRCGCRVLLFKSYLQK